MRFLSVPWTGPVKNSNLLLRWLTQLTQTWHTCRLLEVVYEVIDATALPSPRLPFNPIHWSWHHQCQETYPTLFTGVLHSLRQPSILTCVSDVSPYDPFRLHSPLGWYIEHFPAHHDIIGRTLPRSDQFYSSVSRPLFCWCKAPLLESR
jgi:hypothetical protein